MSPMNLPDISTPSTPDRTAEANRSMDFSGPRYWRSVDELAETPEFQQWLQQEFPAGASEFSDPVSRRHFVKIMSASFLLAGVGLTGCRRPEEKIYPAVQQPADTVPGISQYYATAMPMRSAAIPLLVRSHEGRPVKIEGNPNHPESNGGTDHFAQSAILSLYDPDRATRFAENGKTRTRQDALAFLGSISSKLQTNSGEGLAFLVEQSSSPSRERLEKLLRTKFPKARWCVYEPVDLETHRRTASLVFGTPVTPHYKLDQAEVILSIDCDFIGNEENAWANIRRFAQTRRLSSNKDKMSRLYSIESLFTLTGANADHRLRIAPGMVVPVLARFALELLRPWHIDQIQLGLRSLAARAKEHENWIVACAKDLRSNRGKSLVMPGHRLSQEAQLLVLAINEALGAVARTIEYRPCPEFSTGALSSLVSDLNGGLVDTLVILGGNPVYNAPSHLNWSQAQAKAKTVIRLGYYEDETAWSSSLYPGAQKPVHWDFPAAHFLESWGDARSSDGTLLSIQPLLQPLFGGLTELELIATLLGLPKTAGHDIVRDTFNNIASPGEEAWKKFLHDGFLPQSAPAPIQPQLNWSVVYQVPWARAHAQSPSAQSLDVLLYRDYKVDDGRFSNNGWLQEMPDPITTLTWDNAILVSPKTARELQLVADDRSKPGQCLANVVEIQVGNQSVRGPVLVQPGMADYTLGLALGYGRERCGRIGQKVGFNAYKLYQSYSPHFLYGATVTKINAHHPLAVTQTHWSMENRSIVRESNLAEYQKNPTFAKAPDNAKPLPSLYKSPLDAAQKQALHQWGMSIDLNLCLGCSACVIACQSENNVPIVGKEMVRQSREMHWLRVDRYYTGSEDAPNALTQPMFCQHCETAPCEYVCPVNATVHDSEGLNLMVYNRCVGTRYCSNNCPYKVRRFNFFDYNRRKLDRLYESPLDPRNRTDGEWEFFRWLKNRDAGNLSENEWQLLKLAKNPDVTVRMRGIMEKCTFCVQRIEQAKIAQKVKAGNSDQIRLSEREGTVPQTACQQACPAKAIVFGDVSDPNSAVSKQKTLDRDYRVFEGLGVKPRLSYLAKVRNLNPEMPA